MIVGKGTRYSLFIKNMSSSKKIYLEHMFTHIFNYGIEIIMNTFDGYAEFCYTYVWAYVTCNRIEFYMKSARVMIFCCNGINMYLF